MGKKTNKQKKPTTVHPVYKFLRFHTITQFYNFLAEISCKVSHEQCSLAGVLLAQIQSLKGGDEKATGILAFIKSCKAITTTSNRFVM